jgi:hypothetical protein
LPIPVDDLPGSAEAATIAEALNTTHAPAGALG